MGAGDAAGAGAGAGGAGGDDDTVNADTGNAGILLVDGVAAAIVGWCRNVV